MKSKSTSRAAIHRAILRVESLQSRTFLTAEIVADIWPGPGSGLGDSPIVDVGGTIYFPAQTSEARPTLWKSDGTPAGTLAVAPNLENPHELIPFNGSLYFAARDPVFGTELFRYNTANNVTTRLTNTPNGNSDDPESFPGIGTIKVAGGRLYFLTTRYREADLWTTDGSAGGTIRLSGVSYFRLVDVNGKLLFTNGENLLTVTDGTTAGTRVISPPPPSGPVIESFIEDLVSAGDRAYFTRVVCSDDRQDVELWSTDGTPTGSIKLQDGSQSTPDSLTPLGNELVYVAYSTMDNGWKLFRTNGTTAGTKLVRDFTDATASPSPFTHAGGRLFFTVEDFYSQQLWSTDGTAVGTRQLETPANEYLTLLRGWRNRVYFAHDTIIDGDKPAVTLYQSDGTPDGTSSVGVFFAWNGYPSFYSLDADVLYFSAEGLNGGLWATDGTPDGTNLVHQYPAAPNSLVISNSTLFCASRDSTHGLELWKVTDTQQPFATLDAGVLRIAGTPAGDAINFAQDGSIFDVTMNGQTLRFWSESISRIQIDSGAGNDVVDGATLALPIKVNAGTGNDRVTGGASADFLRGEGGKDTIYGGRGDDRIEGNSANDYLIGGEGRDGIWAGSGDDRVEGNSGKDTLYGQAGNDALFGGSGNDKLDGGDGNDNLMGQTGSDRMLGGNGNDRFFARDNAADQLFGGSGRDLATVDESLDAVESIEQLLA